MSEATEQPFDISEVSGGVSDPNAPNPGTGSDGVIEAPADPSELVARRDSVIDSMEERIAERRAADNAESGLQQHPLEQSDQPVPPPPGVVPQQAQPQPPPQGVADPQQLYVPPPVEPGVESVQPMHPQAPAPTAPPGYEGHPLADHLVMHEGNAYMRMKVDGEDRLIPADRALAHMQKHEAAEIRMDQATAFQRQLQADSERLQQGFAALNQQQTELTQAPQPPAAGDPADFLEEATQFVTTAFTGSETDAAQQLATLLAKSRTPVQATPAIDPAQIAQQAAQMARQEMTAEQRQQDEQSGYQQFARDFSDIMGDVNLYNMADSMTDRIAEEHPDWLPSQVMQESGHRTREWLAQQRGQVYQRPQPGMQPGPQPTTQPQPPAPTIPQTVIDDRQQRKDGLVVIPAAQTGPQLGAPVEGEDPNRPQSPQEIMAEYRGARGQPT